MNHEKHEVQYYSEGVEVKADLYIPESSAEGGEAAGAPGIVLCHGFAGIKSLLLPPYAEAFASRGYVSLAFDYRGFGESGGERGNLDPQAQINDIRNALTYMQTRSEVDPARIGLWGTSYGGSNAVAAAAADARVKCLAVQMAFANGRRVITGDQSPEKIASLEATIAKVSRRAVTKNRKLMLSVDQILTDPQSIEFYNATVKDFPEIDTSIPLLTIQKTMEHIPENYVSGVGAPIHITGAELDSVNPVGESEALYEKAGEPKAFHLVKGAAHYEVYEGSFFDEVSREQLAWFDRYL